MDTTSKPSIQDYIPWDGMPLLKSDASPNPPQGTPSTTGNASSHDGEVDNDIVEAKELRVQVRELQQQNREFVQEIRELKQRNIEYMQHIMELEQHDIKRLQRIAWLTRVGQEWKQAWKRLSEEQIVREGHRQELEGCLSNVHKLTLEILSKPT